MFTQFDADPRLNPGTTVLSSDDIANAQRDGQNSTYYMDLTPYAVSGGFSVDLSVMTDTDSVKVTIPITPVYYPNGGPVDPDKTIGAIQAALAAATNVGVNWPTGHNLGPVNVSLVWNPIFSDPKNISGDMADQLGTAWDPTQHGINGGFYVYQDLLFQGELHGTWVGLSYTPAAPP